MQLGLGDWKHATIIAKTYNSLVSLLSLYALAKCQNQQNNKHYVDT